MKNKVVSICLAAVLAATVFAGCGESDQNAASAGSAAASSAAVSSAAEETAEAASSAAEETAEAASSTAEETAAASEAAEETAATGEVNWIGQDAEAQEPADGTDFANIKIGEIESYVINDGGWCQATHESIVAAMDELGIPEENLIVLEEIDDTDQATTQAAAEELINEGCNLIFGASTGYASFLPEIAAANPDVYFAQWGNKVDNLIAYEIRSYEG
ncbi:MAG: BMP family ABC transporter substrate-binding protein, partial [Eubacterium sp.]|nr:BMP family ABC transporter substrate-binding protein [Eubacterium sp.]